MSLPQTKPPTSIATEPLPSLRVNLRCTNLLSGEIGCEIRNAIVPAEGGAMSYETYLAILNEVGEYGGDSEVTLSSVAHLRAVLCREISRDLGFVEILEPSTASLESGSGFDPGSPDKFSLKKRVPLNIIRIFLAEDVTGHDGTGPDLKNQLKNSESIIPESYKHEDPDAVLDLHFTFLVMPDRNPTLIDSLKRNTNPEKNAENVLSPLFGVCLHEPGVSRDCEGRVKCSTVSVAAYDLETLLYCVEDANISPAHVDEPRTTISPAHLSLLLSSLRTKFREALLSYTSGCLGVSREQHPRLFKALCALSRLEIFRDVAVGEVIRLLEEVMVEGDIKELSPNTDHSTALPNHPGWHPDERHRFCFVIEWLMSMSAEGNCCTDSLYLQVQASARHFLKTWLSSQVKDEHKPLLDQCWVKHWGYLVANGIKYPMNRNAVGPVGSVAMKWFDPVVKLVEGCVKYLVRIEYERERKHAEYDLHWLSMLCYRAEMQTVSMGAAVLNRVAEIYESISGREELSPRAEQESNWADFVRDIMETTREKMAELEEEIRVLINEVNGVLGGLDEIRSREEIMEEVLRKRAEEGGKVEGEDGNETTEQTGGKGAGRLS